MFRIKAISFCYIGIIFIAMGCAQVVTPTGGSKDSEPPVIKLSKPENFSTNFKNKNVSITFDEYIQLKDLNKSLIISPPMEEKPMIRVKGKTLNINFDSFLKDSTTYNLYFGNALQDFNEGNPYLNFQYVFSTGSYIDSLSIKGKILNAFDLVSVEDVFVMLYSELTDSVPYKQIPEYISKTDKEGTFRINNIRNDKFKIFALKDANNNYLFDNSSEEIAFSDSIITFAPETINHIDTIFKIQDNNTKNSSEKDDLVLKKQAKKPEIDTIIEHSYVGYPIKSYTLLMFAEDFETQYLLNYKRDEKYKLEFIFNRPVKDSLIFEVLDNSNAQYIKEVSTQKDTFIYWLTDTLDFNEKEISCLVSYQKLDSTKQYYWKTDTLKMQYLEVKKSKKDEIESDFKIDLNIKDKSTLDLNNTITINLGNPIQYIDTTNLALFSITDSVETIVPFNLNLDKAKLRKYSLSANWQENTNYRFEILPSAIKDIYGNTNDTLITKFRTQKLDFYGKLLIKINGIENNKNVIVQLITSSKNSEDVIREKYINENQEVEFSFLPPKEFLVKLIFDENNNKVWDTGNYLKHIQPEEVLYFEKPAKIRSNWDVEIAIDLTKRK
ncbi:MAG: hypothetical protein A2W99_10945 [Bacteroidetes bacterium GWF2_33_16]|nr:MAG: hypothetical protein A2X00_04795 [Bacteroidetes bacterium GWE2_32_14]OFY04055.1 MAG: hypothetical protein A2W99_10945 [Bacteroidetes bacterium GWF2_33_16]